MRAAIPALLAAWGALGCASAPPVPVLSAWDAPEAAEIAVGEDEQKLRARADEAPAKLQEAKLLVENEPLVSYLEGVLRVVTPPIRLAGAPRPTVYVLRDSVLTAAVLPNCAILVPVGVLAAMENEAQLAALLAHELAHCLGRHSVIMERYAAVSTSTVERSAAQRAQEEKADAWALQRMIAAGYAGQELLRMLVIVAGDDVPRWGHMAEWRSHPFVRERIQLLQEQARVGGKINVRPYEASVAEVLPIAIELDLEEGDAQRARRTLARFQRLAPGAARGYLLKGDVARLLSRDGRRASEVRAAYERAVELAPDDPATNRALGLLLRELGEEARARALLNRYLQLAPEAADVKLIRRYLE